MKDRTGDSEGMCETMDHQQKSVWETAESENRCVCVIGESELRYVCGYSKSERKRERKRKKGREKGVPLHILSLRYMFHDKYSLWQLGIT